MHIKKIIAEFVLKCFYGEKDTSGSRRDPQQLGFCCELWMQPRANRQKFVKPHAPYVFLDAKKKIVIKERSGIRTPSGYKSVLGKHLRKSRFLGLKSQDFYTLINK